MRIDCAETDWHFEQARILFREYADWLGVDLSYEHFDETLLVLPRIYGPPGGCLLLALEERGVVGCVAMRALPDVGPDVCEMKRLYVRPAFRGFGLGRRLAEAIVAEGRQLGYRRMVLDTLERLERARALYRSLGFREIEPYNSNPLDTVHFMELDLNVSANGSV